RDDGTGVANAHDGGGVTAGVKAHDAHAVIAALVEDAVDARDTADEAGVDGSGFQALQRGAVVVFGDLQLDFVAEGAVDHHVGEREGGGDRGFDEDVDTPLHEKEGDGMVGINGDDDVGDVDLLVSDE